MILPLIPIGADAQSPRDPRRILRRLEENTDRFTRSLDSALDHSSLNGTRDEDEINGYVHDFEEATDRLKNRYYDHGYAPEATREVILRGREIDRFMRQHQLGLRAKGDWDVVRGDLAAWSRLSNLSGDAEFNSQLRNGRISRVRLNGGVYNCVKQTQRVRTARSKKCNCPAQPTRVANGNGRT
jgi:hypothetical protein